MKRNFILLIFLFSSLSLFAQERPIVDIYAGVGAGDPGDTVCIPIKVRNFNRIVSAQFGMRWNPDAFSFVDLNYNLPNLNAQNFNLLEVDQGSLRLAWNFITADLSGATVEDDATIFELCFILQESSAGQFFSFSFDDSILLTEITANDINNNLIIVISDFAPGGIFTNAADNPLMIQPNFFFDLECGSYSAAIEANVTGGQVPYEYSWSGPDVFFSNSATIQNLNREGFYTLEVLDQQGNTAKATIRVDFMGNEEGLPLPSFNSTFSTPECGENTGSIILAPDDPNGDYSYNWGTGAITNSIENLGPGQYAITIIDNNTGCASDLIFTLEPSNTDTEEEFIIEKICAQDTAQIGFGDLSGLENYFFTWNTGATSPTLTVLETGTYTVTATDDICTQVRIYDISAANEALNPDDFQQINDGLACGAFDTEIGVIYNGNDQVELSYLWSTGDTSSTIKVGSEGDYILEVFASNTCATTFNFKVEEEDADFSFNRIVAFLGCNLGQTRIGLDPNDNTAYDYEWSTGASTNTIDVSEPGPYSVTVTETGTTCTQVFLFDEEIRRPDKGTIEVSYECNVVNSCYINTELSVSLSGYTAPITYTLSDGTTSFEAGLDTTFEAYLQRPLQLYIVDARGCADTLDNIISNCVSLGDLSELNVRQYVVCEENEENGSLDATLYNEVIGNLALPPYQFIWSNGFLDTSFFRSSQPLESLPNLFIGVVDAQGNQFSRQISEPVEAYGCGDENAPIFTAADTIVAPGDTFTYPLFIENHLGLERAIYTIDWDPCLVQADSIIFYTANGDTIVERNIFDGTYEVFYLQDGGSTTNEKILLAEVFFRANEGVEGISPFLFSINEVARDADGEIRLVQPNHGSISIFNPNDAVLPGDANLNGIVDHKDLLNLALGLEAIGPNRRITQVERKAFAYPWQNNTPESAVNFRHLDCDGNGEIEEKDTMAISQNFDLDGASIDLRGSNLEGAPLFLDADTLYAGQTQRFPIFLGLENNSVANLYGIALSLRYDATVIDPQSIEIDFGDGWLGTEAELLSIVRNDATQQIIHFALSRKDLQNASGFGPIVHVSVRTIAEVMQESSFEIVGVKAIDAIEQSIAIDPQVTQVAVQTTSNTQQIQQLSTQIKVFPNPVKDKLFLDTNGLVLQEYAVYDAKGRQYLNGNLVRNVIDVQSLPSGIYWLRIVTDQGLAIKKIMKSNY